MLSVHHVGIITVSDLERSVGFYHDLIGPIRGAADAVVRGKRPRARPGRQTAGRPSRRALRGRRRQTWFEILQYRTPPSSRTRALPQSDVGAAHVAFYVEDITATYDELSAKGVEFNSPPNTVDDGPLAAGGGRT